MQAKLRFLWRHALWGPLLWVTLLSALAFVVRLYRLGGPVLRWDEGWSLAHASLPWSQLWQIATEEWHPPAYVALLKLWLIAGQSAWSIRFLSVLLGTATVPLAYKVAAAWSGRRRVAILAAGIAALWPLLVYYGQVARMYALSGLAVLAAAWFLLRGEAEPSWRNDLGLVLSSIVALYTLYYTTWALAGLWTYGVISRRERLGRLALLGLATAAAYLPWMIAAWGTVLGRIGTAGPMGPSAIAGTIGFLPATLGGLAFVQGSGWHAALVLGVVLASGALARALTRAEARKLLLPLLVVGASSLGVAYGAHSSRWFAARHLVPACTFLGLGLAWALDRLATRWWPLVAVALLALGLVYWQANTHFVYEKTLEVQDPFDPAADYRYLGGRAGPDDLVYFSALARAGWYANLRRPQDAAWSYAMRGAPIDEPLERIAARIGRDSRTHHRLWFVLYKGVSGSNAHLVDWLNANLYPAGGGWQGDVLYLAYAAPPGSWTSAPRDDRFADGIRLKGARWTASVSPGDVAALSLFWEADRPVSGYYKVFVHAIDERGRLVAQHDDIPGAGAYPTNAWQVGVEVPDRHGLFLHAAASPGPRELHIRVGLYHPDTGQRLRLADGADSVEVCTISVQ